MLIRIGIFSIFSGLDCGDDDMVVMCGVNLKVFDFVGFWGVADERYGKYSLGHKGLYGRPRRIRNTVYVGSTRHKSTSETTSTFSVVNNPRLTRPEKMCWSSYVREFSSSETFPAAECRLTASHE